MTIKVHTLGRSSHSEHGTLPTIITSARAGALRHAWSMFNASGYDSRTDDPAVLAVKGRLLKDSALRQTGVKRLTLLLEAANAYAAANALMPQPYTQINIATLRLLAGDRAAAIQIAIDLLAWLDRDSNIPETPYYLMATRAEAALICADIVAAEAALKRAIAHNPDGWGDQANTLRQLRLIVAASDIDGHWLDRYQPPRSLHYAGHLGILPARSDRLLQSITDVLSEERIGFGYGALAAGSDIVIAETLLADGAELHVVLPTDPAIFVTQSVEPFGKEWLPRFEACLEAATSLRTASHIEGAYEPLATALAADLAMGASVLNATLLASEAVQLLVVDDEGGRYGAGTGTVRDGTRWAQTGRRQHVITWPRTAPVLASGKREMPEGRADRRLTALLHISFHGLDMLDDAAFEQAVDEVILPFRALSRASDIKPDMTLPCGNARMLAFATVEAAWAYARAMLRRRPPRLPLRIVGHYGLAHWLNDPPSLTGRTITEVGQIAASALPGVLTASEAMTTALFATCADNWHAEHVGEHRDIRLFTITA